jgi:hypothetical protein
MFLSCVLPTLDQTRLPSILARMNHDCLTLEDGKDNCSETSVTMNMCRVTTKNTEYLIYVPFKNDKISDVLSWVDCPETSLTNYQSSLRNIAEE